MKPADARNRKGHQQKEKQPTSMFYLFRKSTSTTTPNQMAVSNGTGSTRNSGRNPVTNGDSIPTNESNNKKSAGMMSFRKPTPTIIRAVAQPRDRNNLSSKKKPAPPRPPPPKVDKNAGCLNRLDPPSYEEVLQADYKAKLSRHLPSNGNAVQKRKAPQPQSAANLFSSLQGTSTSLSPFTIVSTPGNKRSIPGPSLIDLSSPAISASSHLSKTGSNVEAMRELEDIFNNIPPVVSQSSLPSSIVNDNLFWGVDDLHTPTSSSAGISNSGRYEFLYPYANSKTERDKSQKQRPSAEDASESQSSSQQKCQSATINISLRSFSSSNSTSPSGQITGAKSLNETSWSSWPDEDEPWVSSEAPSFLPPLPPRPTSILQESFEALVSSSSNSSLSDQPPPPLPPRPQNYGEITQESENIAALSPTHLLSLQRIEPHGIALFDYEASQNDELSFKVNDIITLIHRTNNEWLYGLHGNHEGIFPRNFIQVIVPLPDDPEFQAEGVEPVVGPRCLALFDFAGDNSDELSFRVGDMIRLEGVISEHWLRGSLNGQAGVFPSNFVRIVENLPKSNVDDSGTYATVLYDFGAATNEELDCKAEDVVRIVEEIDSNWLIVERNGTRGLIPRSFLVGNYNL